MLSFGDPPIEKITLDVGDARRAAHATNRKGGA
jgi:hypothetical protein